MEVKIDSVIKISTTTDAYNFLVQSTELKNHRTIDYFFALYLDRKNQVIDFKVVQKRNTDSLSDTFSLILAFDEIKNIDSLLVFHKPAKYSDLENEKELANQLVDKAFFALVNIIDFIVLYSPKYYVSMHDRNINIPNKHRYKLNEIIRMNEQSKCSQQDLFDMGIDSIKSLIEFEFYKIIDADHFVFLELIDIDYIKYDDMRFRSVFPHKLEHPSSMVYLVSVFNEYMKHKSVLMNFIIKSNRYEKYLLYKFDHAEYHNQRKQIKSTTPVSVDVFNPVKVLTSMFKPGKKVMINKHAKINSTLPYGIKNGSIYLVDDIQTCPCGNTLLVLNGPSDPEVKSRICSCGKDGFHPRAFNSMRFQPVNLEIIR